jgi:hypothetical protein
VRLEVVLKEETEETDIAELCSRNGDPALGLKSGRREESEEREFKLRESLPRRSEMVD